MQAFSVEEKMGASFKLRNVQSAHCTHNVAVMGKTMKLSTYLDCVQSSVVLTIV